MENDQQRFEQWCEDNEDRCREAFNRDCLFHNTPIGQQQLAWRYYCAGWLKAAYQGELRLLELDVALRRLIANHLP